jgi:glutamate synthase domain-containing protein 3
MSRRNTRPAQRYEPCAIVFPVSPTHDDVHLETTGTDAGQFTSGLVERGCYLCRAGTCIQRVTRGIRGTLVVHGRLG